MLVSDTELAMMLEQKYEPKEKKGRKKEPPFRNEGIGLPYGQLGFPRNFEVQHVFLVGRVQAKQFSNLRSLPGY